MVVVRHKKLAREKPNWTNCKDNQFFACISFSLPLTTPSWALGTMGVEQGHGGHKNATDIGTTGNVNTTVMHHIIDSTPAIRGSSRDFQSCGGTDSGDSGSRCGSPYGYCASVLLSAKLLRSLIGPTVHCTVCLQIRSLGCGSACSSSSCTGGSCSSSFDGTGSPGRAIDVVIPMNLARRSALLIAPGTTDAVACRHTRHWSMLVQLLRGTMDRFVRQPQVDVERRGKRVWSHDKLWRHRVAIVQLIRYCLWVLCQLRLPYCFQYG